MDTTFFTGHDLTKHVIQAIEAANRAAGSVEEEFLSLLRQKDGAPQEVLRQRVRDYALELEIDLENPAIRPARLQQLFGQLIDSRQRVLADPRLGSLDETGGLLLFPTP